MGLPGAIVAVDVDNLLISSAQGGQSFEGYMGSAHGFENMFQWIDTFAEVYCAHFYLSSRQASHEEMWHKLWTKYKNDFLIETIYCPKKSITQPGEKPDNVDEHLICHSRKMVQLHGPSVKYFVLASGDSDYSPFLSELKRDYVMDIAFELGSERSFSAVYRQARVAGYHPNTHEELIHYFTPREEL